MTKLKKSTLARVRELAEACIENAKDARGTIRRARQVKIDPRIILQLVEFAEAGLANEAEEEPPDGPI